MTDQRLLPQVLTVLAGSNTAMTPVEIAAVLNARLVNPYGLDHSILPASVYAAMSSARGLKGRHWIVTKDKYANRRARWQMTRRGLDALARGIV